MAALGSQSIATSYEQLLHVDRDGGGNTSTAVSVKDGDNETTFCISMTDASTGKAVLAVDGSHASGTEVQIDNSATTGDSFLSFQLGGTSKFTMGVDDSDDDKFKIGTTAVETDTALAIEGGSITMPSQPAFSFKPASTQSDIAYDQTVTIAFGAEVFDQGSDFASNAFTAPVTGKYQLNTHLYLINVDSASTGFTIYFVTHNRQYEYTIRPDQLLAADDSHSIDFSVLADMDACDTAEVKVYQLGGVAQTDIHTDSMFSGFLAC